MPLSVCLWFDHDGEIIHSPHYCLKSIPRDYTTPKFLFESEIEIFVVKGNWNINNSH